MRSFFLRLIEEVHLLWVTALLMGHRKWKDGYSTIEFDGMDNGNLVSCNAMYSNKIRSKGEFLEVFSWNLWKYQRSKSAPNLGYLCILMLDDWKSDENKREEGWLCFLGSSQKKKKSKIDCLLKALKYEVIFIRFYFIHFSRLNSISIILFWENTMSASKNYQIFKISNHSRM